MWPFWGSVWDESDGESHGVSRWVWRWVSRWNSPFLTVSLTANLTVSLSMNLTMSLTVSLTELSFLMFCVLQQSVIRGGADKSLARTGRKQATATKLGIYSTYSPRNSIHFLARCPNFCKPLKKKIQKVVRPTRSPRQQWPPRRTKNGDLSILRCGIPVVC